MKLDIKSFLIGILTTVNLFLLMGFDDHEEENQNGRYQVIIDSKGDQYWYDTRFGDKIAIGSKSYGYISSTIPNLKTLEGKIIKPYLYIVENKNINYNLKIKSDYDLIFIKGKI